MRPSTVLVVLALGSAAGWLCPGCGEHGWPKPSKTTRKPRDGGSITVSKVNIPKPKPVIYCPQRDSLIREADELHRRGEEHFKTWRTTDRKEDIQDAVRLLNQSYDKYRQAKDKYGADAALSSKIQRTNRLRWLAMKHTPL